MSKWSYKVEEIESNTGSAHLLNELIYWLSVFWRRKLLLLLPSILALPLGFGVIQNIPKVFETKAMILFNASQIKENPFSNDAGSIEALAKFRIRENIGAMEAWLKSDHILTELLYQVHPNTRQLSAEEQETRIRIFRSNIFFEPVGNSALQLILRGNDPIDLGKKLELIVSRFLEGLSRPDDNIFNASTFLLLKFKENLSNTNKKYDELIEFRNKSRERLLEFSPEKIELMNSSIKAKTEKLNKLSETLEKLDRENKSKSKILATDYGRLKNIPSETRTREANLPDINNDISTEILKIENQKAKIVSEINELTNKLDQINSIRSRLDRTSNEIEVVRNEVKSLALAVQLHQQKLQDSPIRNIGIFSGLENAILIGRPKDPISPINRRIKLAIAVIFLTVLSGAGLIVLVEIMDPKIRKFEEYEKIMQVPIVIELPKRQN